MVLRRGAAGGVWWFCGLAVMIDSVLGWNFSSLNMTNDDVTVLHVSVYYMRAYLSIKSDVEGRKSEWN